MHIAAIEDKANLISVLLQSGADPNLGDSGLNNSRFSCRHDLPVNMLACIRPRFDAIFCMRKCYIGVLRGIREQKRTRRI